MRGFRIANLGPRDRPYPVAVVVAMTLLSIALIVGWSPVLAASGSANSGATITGSFNDDCRDFTATSSKDMSHVEIHFSDARVVKDETVGSRDYEIDGAAGDEIHVAIVKAGTTRQSFTCQAVNDPPTAVLEIRTPRLVDCQLNDEAFPLCLGSAERTEWSRPTGGIVGFAFEAPFPAFTFTFRGTSSSDPDNDIVSWSIDFADSTSTIGNWLAQPPSEITHVYAGFDVLSELPAVTLTVMDAAGQSDMDTITLAVVDITPD